MGFRPLNFRETPSSPLISGRPLPVDIWKKSTQKKKKGGGPTIPLPVRKWTNQSTIPSARRRKMGKCRKLADFRIRSSGSGVPEVELLIRIWGSADGSEGRVMQWRKSPHGPKPIGQSMFPHKQSRDSHLHIAPVCDPERVSIEEGH